MRISSRLISYLLLCSTVMILCLAGIHYYAGRSAVERESEKVGYEVSERLAALLANPLYEFDRKTVENILRAEFLKPEVAAVLVWNKNHSKVINGFRRYNGMIKTCHTQPAGKNILYVIKPIIQQNSSYGKMKLGNIEVCIDRSAVYGRFFKEFLVRIAEVSLLVIMIVLISGLVVNKSIVQPLDALYSAMEKIRKEAPDILTENTMESALEPLHKVKSSFPELMSIMNRFTEMLRTVFRNQKALQVSEKNISITLDSIRDAVITTDANSKVTRINPAASEILHLRDEDIVGKDISKCITLFRLGENDSEEELELGVNSVSDPSSPLNKSNTVLIKGENGENMELLISCAPIKSSDKVLGSVIVMRDVTEQRKMQTQLHQSQKMESLGQLAGGMAHDFNNMLCGIIGAAELLKIKTDNKEMLEYIELILNASSRAGELTHSLLTFSRKKEIVFSVVDIHDVIDETVGIVRRTFDKKINIKVEKCAENSKIRGDATLLQNSFMNICINARDAMPDGGELNLSTTNVDFDSAYCENSPYSVKPGEYIEISIRDTGSGMEQKELKKIFEPFYTTKPRGKGTGLGLSMVYSAMADHYGTVTVYSELQHGTVFHLYLPVAKESENRGKDDQIFYGSGLILVVDDEEMIRKMSKKILESFGYSVLLAENGKEGAEVYRENKEKIDAVILDAVMPVMNGFECLKEIRKINTDAKVLLASGFVQEKTREDIETSGICGFIQKPYRKAVLSKAVFDTVRKNKS